MKIIICILTLSFLNLHGRNKDSTQYHHPFSFGVELFQSAVPISMMHYNYQQWIIHQNYDYPQLTNPAGYGLFIQKEVQKSFIGLRAGYISFNRHESGGFISKVSNNASSNPFEITLKQSQMQFVPYFKTFQKLRKLSIGYGFELPLIFYSSGTLKEVNNYYQYYGDGPQLNSVFEQSFLYSMPSGFVKGLMGVIECGYPISKKIDVAFALSSGYLWHTYNKPIFVAHTSESRYYNSDGTLYSQVPPGTNTYTLNSASNLSGFSKIIPSFKFYYHLH